MADDSVDILNRLQEMIIIAENAGYRMSVFWVGAKTKCRKYCAVNGGVDSKIFMCMRACFRQYNPDTDDRLESHHTTAIDNRMESDLTAADDQQESDLTAADDQQEFDLTAAVNDWLQSSLTSDKSPDDSNKQTSEPFADSHTNMEDVACANGQIIIKEEQDIQSPSDFPISLFPDPPCQDSADKPENRIVLDRPMLLPSGEEPNAHAEFPSTTMAIDSMNVNIHTGSIDGAATLRHPKESGLSESAYSKTTASEPSPFNQQSLANSYSCKKYQCTHCDYKSPTLSQLKSHVVTHSGKRLYKCLHCDYTAIRPNALKVHQKTHTQERPYECTLCDYKCNTTYGLKVHLRTHTGEKPYKCRYCSYTATQHSHLAVHEKIHTQERPHACSLCEYKCGTKSSLKLHMRTHTGEKPYKCLHCNYATTQSSHLKVHQKVHTQRSTIHNCSYCDYKCARPSQMKIHLRTHTGEKPFKCQHCDYVAAQTSHLLTHIRRVHNELTSH